MRSTIQYIQNELAGLYHPTEISGFVRLILESVYDLSFTEQKVNQDRKFPEKEKNRVYEIVARLRNHEPIQFILGEAWFYGLRLKVQPGVLVPRPETEELVNIILKSGLQGGSRVLDIGTGSGAIALALKNECPDATVEGIDVSETALKVASENARMNQLNVHFYLRDVLNWKASNWSAYDLIVSNPPYVRESEKDFMEPNVLLHEPETALFVDDADPLLFYRAIAAFSKVHLKKGGSLFFEINEYLGTEMKALLNEFDFKQIELHKDINGRDRIMYGRK